MHSSVLIYKRAWEEQNVDLLAECFAEDAIYIARPVEMRPARYGLSEIQSYWRENVVGMQNAVQFTILRSIESDHEVWLEWQSESKFAVLLPNDPPFKLWGAMIFDLNASGKIKRLTEYYFWDEQQRQRLEAARLNALRQ